MASLRTLKKDINGLTDDLITECFVYQHFHSEMTDEKLLDILQKVTVRRNELVSRINGVSGMKDKKEAKKQLQAVRESIPAFIDILDELKK